MKKGIQPMVFGRTMGHNGSGGRSDVRISPDEEP